MVMSWSHMMYKAEDHFLNFLEDVTDPHHHSHPGHHSRIDHDIDNPHIIYSGPVDHYDELGNAAKHDFQTKEPTFLGIPPGSFDIHRHVSLEDEEWTGDVTRLTNAIGFLKVPPKPLPINRYVALENEDTTGGITRMTNIFGFHNDIPKAEKIKHLNVVLGGTQKHDTDIYREHTGVATELVPPHEAYHPQTHVKYPPHSLPLLNWHHTSNKSYFVPTRAPSFIKFENKPWPPRDGIPDPRFRPSPLMEESLQDDWVVAEHLGPTSDRTDTDPTDTNLTLLVTEESGEYLQE